MKNEKIRKLTYGAMIAALYFVLTWISELAGLAYMTPQIRLGEALCVLTWLTPAAVPGLFAGCLLANLTMGCVVWDVIFGSLATLIGAYVGSKIKIKWLVPLPTVISNAVIIPFIIIYCYMDTLSLSVYVVTALTVLIGEIVSAYVIGILLLAAMSKHSIFMKK
ncbi:MAG: QueT transporter family protein [Clostridia bacterium]|nr:QueT transporter family protein [Clostridia bacterium]